MGAGIETTEGHLPLRIQGRPLRADRLRAAGRERAGEVGDPARRPLTRTATHDRRRAGADARPHGAACSPRPGARVEARERARHGLARRAARAGRGRGAGRLLVRRAVSRRGDARPGLRAPRPRRQPQPAADRPARDPRAHGRPRSRSTTAARSAASRAATSRSTRAGSSARRSRRTEVPLAIDELPLFALAAACARGESVLRGAEELRAKETDRIEATVDALARARGARAGARDDGFVVRGVPTRLRGGRLSRAAATTASRCSARSPGSPPARACGSTDADAVAVSFPGFFEMLDELRRARRRELTADNLRAMIVAIDGPAGAGKSSVARALAERLGFHYLDTGAMYRALTWLALAARRRARRRAGARRACAGASGPVRRRGLRSRSTASTSPSRSASPRSTLRCRSSPVTRRCARSCASGSARSAARATP